MDGKPVTTPTEVLVLSGDSIHYASTDSKTGPIYRLSKSIDSLTHKDSSIRFFSCRQVKGEGADKEEEEGEEAKVEARPADDDDDPGSRRRIFNLVHPVNAQYRRDYIAAEYYMTSASASSPSSSSSSSSSLRVGNIKFQISKSFFGKVVEIKAILSAGRNETSSPLFDDDDAALGNVLFVAKQKLTIGGKGGFVWIDAKGKEVAREEGNGRLVLIGGRSWLKKSDAEEEWMDHALVAVWVLRLWWEVAESSKFKREAELALLQGTGEQSLLSMRWAKKAGIAGLSGAGGAR